MLQIAPGGFPVPHLDVELSTHHVQVDEIRRCLLDLGQQSFDLRRQRFDRRGAEIALADQRVGQPDLGQRKVWILLERRAIQLHGAPERPVLLLERMCPGEQEQALRLIALAATTRETGIGLGA